MIRRGNTVSLNDKEANYAYTLFQEGYNNSHASMEFCRQNNHYLPVIQDNSGEFFWKNETVRSLFPDNTELDQTLPLPSPNPMGLYYNNILAFSMKAGIWAKQHDLPLPSCEGFKSGLKLVYEESGLTLNFTPKEDKK